MKRQKICLFALSTSLFFNSCKIEPSKYDNNKIYNTKEVDKAISYEDIILTMYEKDIVSISDIGKNYIDKLENVPIDYSSEYMDMLNINFKSLSSKYVVSNTNIHSYNKYYDSNNNTIRWDMLVDKIYNNSKNRENNIDLIPSKTEIETILLQMDEFLNIVKNDYPSFDVANLACKLNDLSILYFYREDSDKERASCIQDVISIGIDTNGTKVDLNGIKSLLFHEFKHYFCFCCKDEMLNSYSTAGGISSKEGYDINLLFLEEAEAEEYSTFKSNIEMTCYSNQYTTLNTLRLILSMQDDYKEDNFIKYQLLHNPIKLLQQFPVYDNDKIYYRNIAMLECLNELLMNSNNYDNQEIYQTYLNYSLSELNRMFFSNLISLNEKYDVLLDYNLFIIELYKEQLNNTYNALNKYNLDNSKYIYNLEQCYNLFIKYYSLHNNIDINTIIDCIEYYKLRLPSEYPSYIEKDKIKLYDYIYSNNNDNVLTYK